MTPEQTQFLDDMTIDQAVQILSQVLLAVQMTGWDHVRARCALAILSAQDDSGRATGAPVV